MTFLALPERSGAAGEGTVGRVVAVMARTDSPDPPSTSNSTPKPQHGSSLKPPPASKTSSNGAAEPSEKALVAVIQDAGIGGVLTRRVDELVQAMGLAGISKGKVSKLCKDIDDGMHAFLDRPLVGDCPYLWLGATYLG